MKRTVVLLCCAAAGSAAQNKPPIEVRGSIGASSFVDDGRDDHTLVAGAIRYYVTKRLAVEGEYQYLHRNANHQDHILLPALVYDLRKGRVVPYLSIGAGWIRSVDTFQRSVTFNSDKLYFESGAGVKVFMSDNWYVAPDFRAGWPLHGRLSVAVGYSFRGK